MACAMGCILTPLRGYRLIVSFHDVVEILVFTHTLKALRDPKQSADLRHFAKAASAFRNMASKDPSLPFFATAARARSAAGR
jgi:hypothetical protein